MSLKLNKFPISTKFLKHFYNSYKPVVVAGTAGAEVGAVGNAVVVVVAAGTAVEGHLEPHELAAEQPSL